MAFSGPMSKVIVRGTQGEKVSTNFEETGRPIKPAIWAEREKKKNHVDLESFSIDRFNVENRARHLPGLGWQDVRQHRKQHRRSDQQPTTEQLEDRTCDDKLDR